MLSGLRLPSEKSTGTELQLYETRIGNSIVQFGVHGTHCNFSFVFELSRILSHLRGVEYVQPYHTFIRLIWHLQKENSEFVRKCETSERAGTFAN